MLIEKLTGDRFFSSHAIAPVYLCNHIADCANKVQVLLAASAAMQTFVGHEIPSSRLIIRIGVLRLNFFIFVWVLLDRLIRPRLASQSWWDRRNDHGQHLVVEMVIPIRIGSDAFTKIGNIFAICESSSTMTLMNPGHLVRWYGRLLSSEEKSDIPKIFRR